MLQQRYGERAIYFHIFVMRATVHMHRQYAIHTIEHHRTLNLHIYVKLAMMTIHSNTYNN